MTLTVIQNPITLEAAKAELSKLSKKLGDNKIAHVFLLSENDQAFFMAHAGEINQLVGLMHGGGNALNQQFSVKTPSEGVQ